MTNKMIHIVAFSVFLSLSACVEEDVSTAENDSALVGTSTWKNVATLRCLDSNGNGSVYTLGCNRGGFQLWTSTERNFGNELRDDATGRCLDSNTAGKVYTLSCNGGAFQQWTARAVGTVDGSSYFEFRNVATGLCLDSNGSGSVYTLGCNGGNFQHWK